MNIVRKAMDLKKNFSSASWIFCCCLTFSELVPYVNVSVAVNSGIESFGDSVRKRGDATSKGFFFFAGLASFIDFA